MLSCSRHHYGNFTCNSATSPLDSVTCDVALMRYLAMECLNPAASSGSAHSKMSPVLVQTIRLEMDIIASHGALRILSLLNWSKLYSQSIYSDCLNMQTSQNVKIVEPDSSKWYNLAFYIYKNIGIKSIFPCATRLNTRVGCHSSSPVSAESIQQGHKGNICGFQGNSRTNFPAPL